MRHPRDGRDVFPAVLAAIDGAEREICSRSIGWATTLHVLAQDWLCLSLTTPLAVSDYFAASRLRSSAQAVGFWRTVPWRLGLGLIVWLAVTMRTLSWLPRASAECRSRAVVMVKASKHRYADDERRIGRRFGGRLGRHALFEPLMRARGVEIPKAILLEHLTEVPLAESDNVVETVAPDAAENLFANRIHERSLDCSEQTKTFAMPAKNGFGLHEQQRVAPSRKRRREHSDQRTLVSPENRSLHLPGCHDERVAQKGHPPRSTRPANGADQSSGHGRPSTAADAMLRG